MAGSHGFSDQVSLVACTVVSVDVNSRTCTCTPVSGKSTVPSIVANLMAEVDDGVLILPSAGSTVIVGYNNSNEPVVLLYSKIDEVLFITGDTSLKIDNDGIKGSVGESVSIALTKDDVTSSVGDNNIKVTSDTIILTQGGAVMTMQNGKYNIKNDITDLLTLVTDMTFTNGGGTTDPPNNITDWAKLLF